MKQGDRSADRPVDSRSGRAGAVGPDAGRHRQRIQPRHADRGGSRQHRPRSGALRRLGDPGDEALRPAPPLHRRQLGGVVWRRHEARIFCTAPRPRSARFWPTSRSRSKTCTPQSSRRWASRPKRLSRSSSGRFTPPKTASASRSASCLRKERANSPDFDAGDCPNFAVRAAKMGLSPSVPLSGVAPLGPARQRRTSPRRLRRHAPPRAKSEKGDGTFAAPHFGGACTESAAEPVPNFDRGALNAP